MRNRKLLHRSFGQHRGPKPPSHPVVNERAKIRGNDPCPCGSGKKFKLCCRKGPEEPYADVRPTVPE
jgi:hypothetical protein